MQVAQKEMVAASRSGQCRRSRTRSPSRAGSSGSLPACTRNIGVLLYVQKKFDEAEPHLRKGAATLMKLWLAQAMLAAILFRPQAVPGDGEGGSTPPCEGTG